jgi:two-component system KDP operon response regulator KdpE
VPIIVVSARGDEARKIEALDEGANDYVMKPFVAGELLARIRVALRSARPVSKKAPLKRRSLVNLAGECDDGARCGSSVRLA